MSRRRTALAAAAVALAWPGAAPAAQSPDGSWVTAWQAAPHSAGGEFNGLGRWSLGFADQSVRTVVSPHAAGTEVRVRLSNVFGRRPVTFTAVSIARREQGAALVPGTVRTLTFSGQRSVTVPAGAWTVSDPAPMDVQPFADLAVTTAFARPTGAPTVHHGGYQTSFVSRRGSGDLTARESAAGFSSRTTARFFVAGVETLGAPDARTVVAVGDSITDGAGKFLYESDRLDLNARWPDFLQRRLLEAGSTASLANAGIGGNRVSHGIPSPLAFVGPPLTERFDRDVLAHPNLGAILLLEGTNDLGTFRSPGQLIGALKAIAARAHAAGVPIAIGTLTPMGDSSYDIIRRGPLSVERRRRTVNAWIRTQNDFDAVIDFDAAVRDPARPSRMQPQYDSGDHLHPSPAGYAAMAAAVDLGAIDRLVRAASDGEG